MKQPLGIRRAIKLSIAAVLATGLLASCNDDTSDAGIVVPQTYDFDSQFLAGSGENISSVHYLGQVCRHVLISALKNAIKDPAEVSGVQYRGNAVPYFDDTIAGDLANESTANILATNLPVLETQDTLGELCGTKHLKEKFAGNDTVTDWKDWTTEFAGVAGYDNAETYLRDLISEVSQQAETGVGAVPGTHYVSLDGIDYAEMVQKFLLGAVAFAQAADDYLDNDAATPGKGLLASAEQSGQEPYSSFEHAFDEGYGYFGAARAYNNRSDAQNTTGVFDDNRDGFIDLHAEHNFGASTNAAKRDEGSAASAKTNFTGQAFDAFRRGRTLITRAGIDFEAMPGVRQAQLLGYRDEVLTAWEGAIAATVVHYINDTLADLSDIGVGPATNEQIVSLAKHFSEMKGFALGFQFSPHSPMNATDNGETQSRFEILHELLRDSPALFDDPQYRADLLEARSLLGSAYGFAQANLEAW